MNCYAKMLKADWGGGSAIDRELYIAGVCRVLAEHCTLPRALRLGRKSGDAVISKGRSVPG